MPGTAKTKSATHYARFCSIDIIHNGRITQEANKYFICELYACM